MEEGRDKETQIAQKIKVLKDRLHELEELEVRYGWLKRRF